MAGPIANNFSRLVIEQQQPDEDTDSGTVTSQNIVLIRIEDQGYKYVKMDVDGELSLGNPGVLTEEYKFDMVQGQDQVIMLRSIKYQQYRITGHTDPNLEVDGKQGDDQQSQSIWHTITHDENRNNYIISLYIMAKQFGNKKYFFYYNTTNNKFQLKEVDTPADIKPYI